MASSAEQNVELLQPHDNMQARLIPHCLWYHITFRCHEIFGMMSQMSPVIKWYSIISWGINSSPPGQNGHHFPDDIFKCIFMNEKFCILIRISLKFVPKGPINNIPALVQIMACRLIGAKPLFEPMLIQFTDAYMRHQGEMSWIKHTLHWCQMGVKASQFTCLSAVCSAVQWGWHQRKHQSCTSLVTAGFSHKGPVM